MAQNVFAISLGLTVMLVTAIVRPANVLVSRMLLVRVATVVHPITGRSPVEVAARRAPVTLMALSPTSVMRSGISTISV